MIEKKIIGMPDNLLKEIENRIKKITSSKTLIKTLVRTLKKNKNFKEEFKNAKSEEIKEKVIKKYAETIIKDELDKINKKKKDRLKQALKVFLIGLRARAWKGEEKTIEYLGEGFASVIQDMLANRIDSKKGVRYPGYVSKFTLSKSEQEIGFRNLTPNELHFEVFPYWTSNQYGAPYIIYNAINGKGTVKELVARWLNTKSNKIFKKEGIQKLIKAYEVIVNKDKNSLSELQMYVKKYNLSKTHPLSILLDKKLDKLNKMVSTEHITKLAFENTFNNEKPIVYSFIGKAGEGKKQKIISVVKNNKTDFSKIVLEKLIDILLDLSVGRPSLSGNKIEIIRGKYLSLKELDEILSKLVNELKNAKINLGVKVKNKTNKDDIITILKNTLSKYISNTETDDIRINENMLEIKIGNNTFDEDTINKFISKLENINLEQIENVRITNGKESIIDNLEIKYKGMNKVMIGFDTNKNKVTIILIDGDKDTLMDLNKIIEDNLTLEELQNRIKSLKGYIEKTIDFHNNKRAQEIITLYDKYTNRLQSQPDDKSNIISSYLGYKALYELLTLNNIIDKINTIDAVPELEEEGQTSQRKVDTNKLKKKQEGKINSLKDEILNAQL